MIVVIPVVANGMYHYEFTGVFCFNRLLNTGSMSKSYQLENPNTLLSGLTKIELSHSAINGAKVSAMS